MKNLKQFMRQMKSNPIIRGFENSDDVFAQFEESKVKNIKIVFACYEQEDYEGRVIVFFYDSKTRKYFQTYGSHCSCYGLEGQWTWNDEINFKELENRLDKGNLYDDGIFRKLYLEFLTTEEE